MKCVDCAWLDSEIICGRHMTHCNNPDIFSPQESMLCPDREKEEDCPHFLQKEGISAYDALSDEDKLQQRYVFQKKYEQLREQNMISGSLSKGEFVIAAMQCFIGMDNARWKYFQSMQGGE